MSFDIFAISLSEQLTLRSLFIDAPEGKRIDAEITGEVIMLMHANHAATGRDSFVQGALWYKIHVAHGSERDYVQSGGQIEDNSITFNNTKRLEIRRFRVFRLVVKGGASL